MQRRSFLQAGLTASIAAPTIARSQGAKVLKFVPQADLAVLDPVYATAYVTRNHAFLVYDTLYGLDENYRPDPQMVEGHVVEDSGRLWTLTLRDGLMFHDGSKVLARDAVASIQRWAARDAFGASLLAATDELSAPNDRQIRFRLNKPFPTLPLALGRGSNTMLPVMPERLARTPGSQQVTEMVGSGPTASSLMSGSPAPVPCIAAMTPTCHAAMARRASPPGRRWPILTASSGTSSPMQPPPPPPCRPERSIGGNSRHQTCCRF